MSGLAPGDVTSCDWDGEAHVGVILATSRHSRTLTPIEAAPILATEAIAYVGNADGLHEHLTALIAQRKPYDWRSVTKREIDDGTHECDRDCWPGDRCTSGSGTAWWTVLSISVREAENLDPGAPSQPEPSAANEMAEGQSLPTAHSEPTQ